MELFTPGLIFVSDGKKYEKALQAISKGIEVIIVSHPPESLNVTLLEDLISYGPVGENVTGLEVDISHNAIKPDTIAPAVLFTIPLSFFISYKI